MPLNLYDQQKRNIAELAIIHRGLRPASSAFLGHRRGRLPLRLGGGTRVPDRDAGRRCAWEGSPPGGRSQGGDKAVLESTHAVPVDPTDPKQRMLDNVVEEMAIAGGLPKPAIYVIPDSRPQRLRDRAPARRSPRSPSRAGLLETLNRDELQGVVSHEMSHVKNYDMRLMTVVAALVGLGAASLGLGTARALVGRRPPALLATAGGGGRSGAPLLRRSGSSRSILAPLIAQLVALAVSREREYLADASGAELTRNPLALASALEKIDAAVAPTPSDQAGRRAPLHRGSARPRRQRPRRRLGEPLLDPSADRQADRAC